MAERTSLGTSSKAYRAAVSASLRRLGEHSMRTAVLLELGVILGVGVAAAVTSLVHWRWWSSVNGITANEVFGDTISPMLGGAVVTFVVIIWRWRRRVAKARVATWVADQETIAQLTKATKAEGAGADDVSRRVHRSLSNLFAAYHNLEIFDNRSSGDAWAALSERLEEYKAAFALLPPVARRFHERSRPALEHFVRAKEFERLSEVMNDASDIMINGEYDLDLSLSLPNPAVITDRSSQRDRFFILAMIVGNREDQAVSLFPTLQLYIDPGRMHMIYQADAEPLKGWEEYRREFPRPANPPLAMPLQLPPKGAAIGYWCFFVGDRLENAERLLGGRRRIETVLEIHDVVSGRRTKSDRFYLELDLIKSLLVPLPPDPSATAAKKRKPRPGRPPTPSADPGPSKPSG